MADYYDDGSGGLGGLGGSLNSFLTNPLTLMSLKMMANNSPRIGQPVNTLEGTSDLLLKAGTIQKAQQDDALKKRAMMQALIDAGIDPAQAKMYAQNPEAGKLAINQLTARQQRGRQQAWEAKASQLDVSPDQTDNQTDDGEDGSPNVQAPGPQTDATPQLDTTPQSAQLDTTPQIDTSSFLPPNTGPKTADAIAAYTKAAYAQQPQGPETVKALAERARLATAETAGKPQAQTLQDYPDLNRGAQAQAAPDYADQSQGAQAQNLPYQAQAQQKLTEPITLSDATDAQPQAGAQYAEARGPTPAPAQESAQQRQKVLEQHIPAGILQWLQLPSDTSVRAKDQPPQQKDQTQFVPQAQPQAPAPQQQAPQQQAPQQQAPQQQAPAPQQAQPLAQPTPPQTATDRALLARETAKVNDIGTKIKAIHQLLNDPDATPRGAAALNKRLDYLYKEYATTNLSKDYNRIIQQRAAQGLPFLSMEDYQKQLKAPLVNIDQKQETAYNQKMGTLLAEQNMEIVKDAQKARGKIATLDQLGQLLKAPNLYVGAGGKVATKAAIWAKTFGIDISNADAGQAAESISNAFALELRNPTGGAGMPGALSDPDRNFLRDMVPSIEKTPGANDLLLDYMKRKEQRSIDVDKQRAKYVKEHGKLDEGFESDLADWSKAHPLFTQDDWETATKIAATAPQTKQGLTPPTSGGGGRNEVIIWERGPDGRPRRAQQ